jgi:hypothetical protein
MKNMKIVVCQFYTSNISYGKFSEEINKKYCEDNCYIYYVEKDGDKIKNKIGSRSWTWYKPFLIQEVFEQHTDCEYVLFIDIDAIFCNNKRKIEEFITNDFSILMTEDYGPSLVNAGVMLIKNNQFSKDFMKNWWDICEEFPQYKEGLWHDQTCIGLWYNRQENTNEFKIIPNDDFNAREYKSDKFIFHAFSYGMLPNRTIDSIYYDKFNIDKQFQDKNLYEIGQYYGTDKHYFHNYYNRFYQKLLNPYQTNCDILEIGVLDGASLKVWNDFFENGIIHGIDINNYQSSLERVTMYNVDQSNEDSLYEFSNKGNVYDVIIDDGSHRMKDVQITVQILFNNLISGGVFVIEDLQTSLECRMPEKAVFGWGDPQKTTALDMLRSIIDGNPSTDYKTPNWDYFINNIESIEISNDRDDSIYAIIKKK